MEEDKCVLTMEELQLELKTERLLNNDLRQEMYELKQNLMRVEAIKVELELENEKLYADIKYSKSDTERALKTHEADIIRNWTSKVTDLKIELEEEREGSRNVIEKLTAEIAALQFQAPVKDYSDDLQMASSEITALLIENGKLKDTALELQSLVDESKSSYSKMTLRIKYLEENLQEMKEILESKMEALQSTTNMLQEVQGEKSILTAELASLKAGPVGELHRGNSLFAEVEDKRQSMESKLRVMANKYAQAKKLLSLKVADNNKLKTDNIRLQRYWQDEDKSSTVQLAKLKESYQRRIDELSCEVRALEKRPESPVIVTISDKDLSQLEWINTVVNNARAEARSLRSKLQECSSQRIMEADFLFLVQQENKGLKEKIMKNEATIEELQMKLDTLIKCEEKENEENKKITPEKELTVKPPKSQTTTKGIRFADDVKDNDSETGKKSGIRRIPKEQDYLKIKICSKPIETESQIKTEITE